MESNGKVIAILEPTGGTSQASGKEWKAQTFVIETSGQYPRKQAFELFGAERIQQQLPAIGDEVVVAFDLESREWNGRWFTAARAYKVDKATAEQPQPAAPQYQAAPQPAAAPTMAQPIPVAQPASAEETDTLPF